MAMMRSGNPPFEFVYREDLHQLPGGVLASEVKLHGGFAADRRAGFGQLYYGMPECGILRIDPDLKRQELIARGDEVWVYYYRDDLAQRVAERPDIFKKVR